MKKLIKLFSKKIFTIFVLAVVLLIGTTTKCKSQTTLSVGDIAFIGINSDGDDDFSMLLLKDITAGTSFYITDKGWN